MQECQDKGIEDKLFFTLHLKVYEHIQEHHGTQTKISNGSPDPDLPRSKQMA